MDKLLELLKDGSVTDTLKNLGKFASIFNPAIGGGLILASTITEQVNNVDDDFLENKIIGLMGTAERIDKMIETRHVDFEILDMLSQNLKSMSEFSQKTAKLLK